MSRVFIPQLPSRFDSKIKAWVPTVDVDHAKEFGDIVVMLPPEASRLETPQIISLLRNALKDYGPDDYVLAMGDPAIIGIVAAIADRASSPLRMLRWDKVTRKYQLMSIDLDEGETDK